LRAVVCQHAELGVREVPDPVPGRGQVLLEVERCGICGSDLHARTGIDEWADLTERLGYSRLGRSDQPLVMGHEFSGRVAEYGPGCREKLGTGTPVVALPLLRTGKGQVDATGLSQAAPGGYAERMLVSEALMLEVPNGLPADLAALTEPMAVAWHAVQRGEVAKGDVAIVVGCGPVGLGVVLALKAKGVRTVVASDFSPRRRELARACGADVVVDPAEGSPFDGGEDRGHLVRADAAFDLAVGALEKLNRLPVGWWHAWRLGDRIGATQPKRPVVFECVGVPGVIESIVQGAPMFSRVVVVGVCVGQDALTPAMAINKELELRFVLGYTPLEFRDTLHLLAEGELDPRPLVTATVGLDGVAGAFDALADPEGHAKVLVDPRSDAVL
jgi:threonine dehydrogenase-like Zn-dependent dehydrogenase